MIKELKKHIADSGIKQKKVAEILCVTPEHLSRVISEQHPMSKKMEKKINDFMTVK